MRAAAAAFGTGAGVTLLTASGEHALAAVSVHLPDLVGDDRPGALAACEHGIFCIDDLRADGRFARIPWRLADGRPIGGYAAIALRDGAGQPVATLAIMDGESRTLDARERTLLAAFGDCAQAAWQRAAREQEGVCRFVDEVLSPAAHDMRGALMSIGGFSDLLLQESYDESRRRELLATVSDQAGRLKRVIDDLTELAALEAHGLREWRPRATPLDTLVEYAVGEVRRERPTLRVDKRIEPQLPPAFIDALPTARALSRLFDCAATWAGDATIDVSLARDPGGPQVALSLAIPPRPGLTATIERSFTPFARRGAPAADPARPAGLSAARRIVELQGGRLELRGAAERPTLAASFPTPP